MVNTAKQRSGLTEKPQERESNCLDKQMLVPAEPEIEDYECKASRFSVLFQPGGEAVVHIDPSPLRQAVRTHLKKYTGVTEADGNQ